MDIVEKYGIKRPNAELVEGATHFETVEEFIDFLKQYGQILKTELITELTSVFNRSMIVEFSSGAAITALHQLLPYTYNCNNDKVMYEIYELATVCAATVSKLKTIN